jgi:hypothetical protein
VRGLPALRCWSAAWRLSSRGCLPTGRHLSGGRCLTTVRRLPAPLWLASQRSLPGRCLPIVRRLPGRRQLPIVRCLAAPLRLAGLRALPAVQGLTAVGRLPTLRCPTALRRHRLLTTGRHPARVLRWHSPRLLVRGLAASRGHRRRRTTRPRPQATRATTGPATVRHPSWRRCESTPGRGRHLLRRPATMERRRSRVRRERLARAAGEPGRADVVRRASAAALPCLLGAGPRRGHAVAAVRRTSCRTPGV